MSIFRKPAKLLVLASALTLPLWSIGCGGQGKTDKNGKTDQQNNKADKPAAGSGLNDGGTDVPMPGDDPADKPAAGSSLNDGGTDVPQPGDDT